MTEGAPRRRAVAENMMSLMAQVTGGTLPLMAQVNGGTPPLMAPVTGGTLSPARGYCARRRGKALAEGINGFRDYR